MVQIAISQQNANIPGDLGDLELYIRNVDEITSTILRSYFSFLRGVKSANNELFKDFYNEVKMEKNE